MPKPFSPRMPGRPKGARDKLKIVGELRAALEEKGISMPEKINEIFEDPELRPKDKIRLIEVLLEYTYCKLKPKDLDEGSEETKQVPLTVSLTELIKVAAGGSKEA